MLHYHLMLHLMLIPTTKKNYTTQFNTPLVLDGPYEVALANITLTPNISNIYGKIIIRNFLSHMPSVFDDNNNLN